jgi:hypothetical protein
MKLSPEQIAQFDRDGYLFFPSLFTPEETQTLNGAVPELYSRQEDYNIREKAKRRCVPILLRTCTVSPLQNYRDIHA